MWDLARRGRARLAALARSLHGEPRRGPSSQGSSVFSPPGFTVQRLAAAPRRTRPLNRDLHSPGFFCPLFRRSGAGICPMCRTKSERALPAAWHTLSGPNPRRFVVALPVHPVDVLASRGGWHRPDACGITARGGGAPGAGAHRSVLCENRSSSGAASTRCGFGQEGVGLCLKGASER